MRYFFPRLVRHVFLYPTSDIVLAAMPQHGRRARPDPLMPVDAPRWIVLRDDLSRAVESMGLPRLTDLRAALLDERDAREREGWQVEDVPPAAAFFFAPAPARDVVSESRLLHPEPRRWIGECRPVGPTLTAWAQSRPMSRNH